MKGYVKIQYLHNNHYTTEDKVIILPSFGKVISHNWYKQIHLYLHFCIEEDTNLGMTHCLKYDLYWTLLFLRSYTFQNKSMIPFKGLLSFRQFISSQCTHFGIKAWVLAVAKTRHLNGFSLYCGKTAEVQTDLSGAVVYDLMKNSVGKYVMFQEFNDCKSVVLFVK